MLLQTQRTDLKLAGGKVALQLGQLGRKPVVDFRTIDRNRRAEHVVVQRRVQLDGA